MRYLTSLLMTGAIFLGSGAAEARAQYREAALVNGWYQKYLHRPAEREGLHGWVSQLLDGTPPEYVQAEILGSEEYFAQHGGHPHSFLAGWYEDVLGRSAAPHEIRGWLERLGHCGDRAELARAFLAGASYELSHGGYPPSVAAPRYRPTLPPAPYVDDEPVTRRYSDIRFNVSRRLYR